MKRARFATALCCMLLAMLLFCSPLTAHAADMPAYDYASFGEKKLTWILTPGDNTGEQFYNLVDSIHFRGYGPDVTDKTYITDDYYGYRTNSGWFWATDCKNRTYTDGTYYVYRFSHNYGNWYMREAIIYLRVRYIVTADVSGAPAGYGGVLRNGSPFTSAELKPGESLTLEVVPVPGHKANVTYGGAACTVSGNKYTFTNADRNFTFQVVYEPTEFSTVSFTQPANATISVNGSTTSPVSVISGVPYTVNVTANTGSTVSSVKVDGVAQNKTGLSVTVNPIAGSKGSSHTVAAETESVSLTVRDSAAMAHINGQEEATTVRNIFNAIYLSSTANYTINDLSTSSMDNNPVIVQVFSNAYGFDSWRDLNIYSFVSSYVDGQNEVQVRIRVGDQVSNTCTLTLYNSAVATDPITKPYTAKPVVLSTKNGADFRWSSSYPTAYIVGIAYFNSSKAPLGSAPKDPGSYYVRVTLAEFSNTGIVNLPKYSNSNYIPLTITEQELTLVAIRNIGGSKTYDGKTAAPTFTATVRGAADDDWALTAGSTADFPFALFYRYSVNGTDFLGGLPTDAGTYTIEVSSGDLSVTGTYTIAPKPVTVSVTAAGKTYDGTADATVFAAADTGVDGESITVTGITGAFDSADAGADKVITLDKANMTLTYHGAVSGNYAVTVPDSLTAAIQPAALTGVSVQQTGTLTYSGAPLTPAVETSGSTIAGSAPTFTYSLVEEGTYGSLPDLTDAGSYTVWYKASAANHETVTGSFPVSIGKADYDMSAAAWDYTEPFFYTGSEHTVSLTGLPEGVTVASYSGHTATETGTYIASAVFSYDSKNYNPPAVPALTWAIENNWQPQEGVEYTVSPKSWTSQEVCIIPASGYAISLRNDGTGLWQDSISCLDETGASGKTVTFYLRNLETGAVSLPCDADYFIDRTAPTGQVAAGEFSWNATVSPITFDRFLKETLSISITAADESSGLAEISYLLSASELSTDDLEASALWQACSGTVTVEALDGSRLICYVRLTDKAGNTAFLSTDGFEFDLESPSFFGAEDGEDLYLTTKLSVTDDHLDTLTLNGESVTSPIELAGNTEATYTVIATDKAGNSSTITVFMHPLSDLASLLDGKTEDNITSEDRDLLDTVINVLEDSDLSEDTAENKQASDLVAAANALLDRVTEAQRAANTEDVTATLRVTDETVTPDDREALEQAAKDLAAAQESYSGNYTEQEQQAQADALERINAALEALDRVEDAEALFEALPETAEPDNKAVLDAYFAAKASYDALSDHEKSIFDKNLTEKLTKLGESLVAYRILSGDNTAWLQGSGKPVTVTANGLYAKFEALEVDGKAVDPSHYTTAEGSTIVTLKAEYLQTLKVGSHTITFVYPDGRAEGTLLIKTASGSSVPVTGDAAKLILWICLLAGSAGCAALVLFLTRKKKR